MLPNNDPHQVLKCRTRIAAVRELPRQEGGYRIGPLAQIEAGSPLEICGSGYNDRTVRVRLMAETFFVFKQDLEQDV